MIVRITLRQGTETEWSQANPVLANGEPGWDTTNKSFKIGDGSTTWNSLPLQSFDPVTLTTLVTQAQAAATAAAASAAEAESVAEVGSASETTPGLIELASEAEAEAGDDTAKAITPATLAAVLAAFAGAVDSVNGQIGTVVLDAADVGARPSTYVPDWTEVTNKPATFAPSTHIHDDRYYTEAEIDDLLTTVSGAAHEHVFADITDEMSLAQVPAGSIISVQWSGTNWTLDGATVSARPSARTDIRFLLIDGTDPSTSTWPLWALTGIDLGLKAPTA